MRAGVPTVLENTSCGDARVIALLRTKTELGGPKVPRPLSAAVPACTRTPHIDRRGTTRARDRRALHGKRWVTGRAEQWRVLRCGHTYPRDLLYRRPQGLVGQLRRGRQTHASNTFESCRPPRHPVAQRRVCAASQKTQAPPSPAARSLRPIYVRATGVILQTRFQVRFRKA